MASNQSKPLPPMAERIVSLAADNVMTYVLLSTGQTVIGNDWTAENDGTISVSPWLQADDNESVGQPMWLDPTAITAIYIPPSEDSADAPWLVKR